MILFMWLLFCSQLIYYYCAFVASHSCTFFSLFGLFSCKLGSRMPVAHRLHRFALMIKFCVNLCNHGEFQSGKCRKKYKDAEESSYFAFLREIIDHEILPRHSIFKLHCPYKMPKWTGNRDTLQSDIFFKFILSKQRTCS